MSTIKSTLLFLCVIATALINGCGPSTQQNLRDQQTSPSANNSRPQQPISRQTVPDNKSQAQSLFIECSKLAEQKQYKELITCLKSVIKLDSDYTQAYYNLGIAQMAIGVNDEAAENLRTYIYRNPNDPKAQLIKKQIRDLEIKHANEQLRGGPKTPKTILEISLVSFRNGVFLVELKNVYERNVYLTMCSHILLHTNQGNIQMTQGGTISGTFEIFDDPKDDCVKGKIKPQNKTLLQPDATIRLFISPKDNSYPQGIDFRSAYITIPVCYQPEGAARGQLWSGQIQLNAN